MGIMSLLEKQRKDQFKFQLNALSYRVENPISNWEIEKSLIWHARVNEDIDSEQDYGTEFGRAAEVNSIHVNRYGRHVKYQQRQLT